MNLGKTDKVIVGVVTASVLFLFCSAGCIQDNKPQVTKIETPAPDSNTVIGSKPEEIKVKNPILLKDCAVKFQSGEWSMDDRFKLTTKFQNTSKKVIKGFQGTIQVTDMFDDVLGNFNINQVFKFYPNQTKTTVGYYGAWILSSDQEKIKTRDASDLKFSFIPDKIIYTDGTKEQY
jgi:hypothetical protein